MAWLRPHFPVRKRLPKGLLAGAGVGAFFTLFTWIGIGPDECCYPIPFAQALLAFPIAAIPVFIIYIFRPSWDPDDED